MPHSGHGTGSSTRTSGCIGQVQVIVVPAYTERLASRQGRYRQLYFFRFEHIL
jgi:hypothetical protein